jgi:hypothetical protein
VRGPLAQDASCASTLWCGHTDSRRFVRKGKMELLVLQSKKRFGVAGSCEAHVCDES